MFIDIHGHIRFFQSPGTLPVSEKVSEIAFGIPWFKHDQPELIEQSPNIDNDILYNPLQKNL